jgi:hypothetical protein
LYFQTLSSASLGGEAATYELPAVFGQELEWPVATFDGNDGSAFSGISPVAPKKRQSLLPLLTVLFLISYGLMTLLIVEQGSTIQTQRALIHDLFSDTMQLAAVRSKAILQRNLDTAQRRAQTPGVKPENPGQDSQVQGPVTQAPSTQSNQSSSCQVFPKVRAQGKNEKKQKPRLKGPSRPAADLTDGRRAVNAI